MKKKLLLFFIVILISTSNFAQTITQGAFMKKIGDFDVYANGEIFFRTMTKVEYDNLVLTKKLKQVLKHLHHQHNLFVNLIQGI